MTQPDSFQVLQHQYLGRSLRFSRRGWKTLIAGVALLLGTALLAYSRWCAVAVEQPRLLEQVVAEVTDSSRRARELAPEQNGWYDLAPLLTEKPGPDLEPFTRLAALVPSAPEETTGQLVGALATAPEVRDFVADLPMQYVTRALGKPQLLWAGDHLALLHDYLPNLHSLQSIVRALTLVGVYRESQGRWQEALLAYLSAARLAACLSGQLTLDGQIKVASLTRSPLERLRELLQGGHLNSQQARFAATSLERLRLEASTYVSVLDRDLVVGLRALAECQHGRLNLMQISGFAWYRDPMLLERSPWLSGWYFQRQQNLLANWCLSRRSALQQLDAVEGSPEEFRRRHPWDAGAVLFVPAYGRSASVQRRALDRLDEVLALARRQAAGSRS